MYRPPPFIGGKLSLWVVGWMFRVEVYLSGCLLALILVIMGTIVGAVRNGAVAGITSQAGGKPGHKDYRLGAAPLPRLHCLSRK